MRQKMEQYMEHMPCPVCKGKRLKPVALAVKLKGKNIARDNGNDARNSAFDYFKKISVQQDRNGNRETGDERNF
jgi:excinuclease UvrABC ATPase subunit